MVDLCVCSPSQTKIPTRTPEWCSMAILTQFLSFLRPFWSNNLGVPLSLLQLYHSPQLLPLQKSHSWLFLIPHICVRSELPKTSQRVPDHPPSLPQKAIQSTTQLQISSVLPTSRPKPPFCPNTPTSLLFCPRISAATPHSSVVRTPKLWSPGSVGCSALHLWTHHLCLHHLPTSAPTAMSCHGQLSPPSSTTARPPSLPQPRERPSSRLSQEFLKPRYRLRFTEMCFKRMQRKKKRSISGKTGVFRPFISLLLLCN